MKKELAQIAEALQFIVPHAGIEPVAIGPIVIAGGVYRFMRIQLRNLAVMVLKQVVVAAQPASFEITEVDQHGRVQCANGLGDRAIGLFQQGIFGIGVGHITQHHKAGSLPGNRS